jgi:hypothetical protein
MTDHGLYREPGAVGHPVQGDLWDGELIEGLVHG